MDTTVTQIDCPHCNANDGATMTNNIVGETIGCKHCGYYRSMGITNLADRAEDNLNWKPEFDIHELKNPLGAFEVRYKNGTGEWGSFFEDCNEQELLDEVQKYKDEIESAVISKYVNGSHITKTII